MAAMRITIFRDPVSKALVDIVGCVESKAIRNMLLNRAETVCKSLGCEKLGIEVPSWSEPFQEWLTSCGYEDLGGHMWPEDREHMITKPTLVMEFQVFVVASLLVA
jgi:hypothetical protein